MANPLDPARRLQLVVGDITGLAVDAIVNAANRALAGGGGVDGAIHRAAGPELKRHTDAHYAGCPTGDCVISPGFGLKARHVIHCVGPVWRGGGADEDRLLAGCYARALALAAANGIASIAFPAISTGIYGFPADRAAGIAISTIVKDLILYDDIERVIFVCFNEAAADHYRAQLAALGKGIGPVE
ncbi:MAG: O-acetyl-ADP-ribose deacetylase [Rhodospirillaceae bacterium]|nr:O-acetyl-ADP-ribose deacetylase [Rhodospirillaceae bacterium]